MKKDLSKTNRIPSDWRILGAILTAMVLMNSCATSFHVRAWSSNAEFDRNINKILVMGLVNDVGRRFDLEREIVDAAREINMSGTKGMALFPPELGKPFDNIEMVRERLQERGYDAILTVTILDVRAERFIPPERRFVPMVYYNRFGNYYYQTYAVVYKRGYLTQETKYFLETNLYELKGGNLVWSGRSFAIDPWEFDRFIPRYSRRLFKELRQDGAIAY